MALITADNNYINSRILSSVIILNAHPSLVMFKNTLASISAECGTCSGKQAEADSKRKVVWNNIRQYLAMLPDSDKEGLRKTLGLLSSDRIRVSFLAGSGNSSNIVTREI